MMIGDTQTFDYQVLAAVRHLTAEGVAGISQAETTKFMVARDGGDIDAVAMNFPLAVDRLRRDGLLMSNPSGQLRLTSAGQRQIS